MEDRVIYRQDGKHRCIIFQRGDGLFQIREDILSYDEDEDVSYWNSLSNTHSGLYETMDSAQVSLAGRPGYQDIASNPQVDTE